MPRGLHWEEASVHTARQQWSPPWTDSLLTPLLGPCMRRGGKERELVDSLACPLSAPGRRLPPRTSAACSLHGLILVGSDFRDLV